MAETTMAKHCAVAMSEMVFLQSEFVEWITNNALETPALDKPKENLNTAVKAQF